jgi:hypothetical protein
MTEPGMDHPRRIGHERRDLSPRAIAAFAACLLAMTVAVQLVMAWMFGWFSGRETPGDSGSVHWKVQGEVPAPRLQVQPAADLKALRAEEDRVLSSYGWIDRAAGAIRIPIDRAMDILAAEGLPARGGASPEGVEER